MIQNKIKNAFLLSGLGLLGACGGSSDSAESTPVTDAIALIAESVEVTGSSMAGARLTTLSQNSFANFSPLTVTPFDASMCDEHGNPVSIANSNDKYPYAHTYCGLTVNSGDTVRGGFSLAQSLICSLEKGGIEFEGDTQEIEPDFDDTDCWPDGGPGGDETPDGIVMSAVGSSPASFNSHFEKGVVFSVEQLGLEFSIAANLDGDVKEFIAYENWVSGDSEGNKGVMAGEIDTSTGVLRFEKRDERVRASCADDSCGWNRHTRIYAQLEMVDGEPTSLESFSYANSNVDVDVNNSGNVHNGTLVTAKGSLADQIYAQAFVASNQSQADLKTAANWTAQDATACANQSGINDAAACSSESGIAKFTTNTNFALWSSATPMAPADWLANFGGFNFNTVNTDTDVAYATK